MRKSNYNGKQVATSMPKTQELESILLIKLGQLLVDNWLPVKDAHYLCRRFGHSFNEHWEISMHQSHSPSLATCSQSKTPIRNRNRNLLVQSTVFKACRTDMVDRASRHFRPISFSIPKYTSLKSWAGDGQYLSPAVTTLVCNQLIGH